MVRNYGRRVRAKCVLVRVRARVRGTGAHKFSACADCEALPPKKLEKRILNAASLFVLATNMRHTAAYTIHHTMTHGEARHERRIAAWFGMAALLVQYGIYHTDRGDR